MTLDIESEEKTGSEELKELLKKAQEIAGGGSKGDTQAQQLIEIAENDPTLEYFTGDDDYAYVRVYVEDHKETWRLRGKPFRSWLIRKFYELNNKPPGSQAIQDAIGLLEAIKLMNAPKAKVFIRLARIDDVLYVDLTDDKWRAIKITPMGWEVIQDPPVLFKRSHGAIAMPVPIPGGNLNNLKPFLNVGTGGDDDDDVWVLLVAFIIGCYRISESGGFPILALFGEQGSAKSTTARLVRYFVDPSKPLLRATPREVRDLLIAASNNWLIAYDNLSFIPAWLSDALSRLSTGGGYGTRALYSDDEEKSFDARRPAIINGIEEVATRGDLLERTIIARLPRIDKKKRQPERVFWAKFYKEYPKLLGVIFDVLSEALRNEGTVNLAELPRMADFAEWVVGAEGKLPWEPGQFIKAYTGNQEGSNELAVEASPIGTILLDMMKEIRKWENTSTELLKVLTERANKVDEKIARRKSWPVNGQSLSGHLTRIAPNLRELGVTIEEKKEKKRRLKSLTYKPPEDIPNSKEIHRQPRLQRHDGSIEPTRGDEVGDDVDDSDDGQKKIVSEKQQHIGLPDRRDAGDDVDADNHYPSENVEPSRAYREDSGFDELNQPIEKILL